MPTILILGAGKIGSLIGTFLAETKEYMVHLADIETQVNQPGTAQSQTAPITYTILDASNGEALEHYVNEHQPDAVISSLPYYCNPTVAEVARKNNIHYFDLTEDVEVTERIEQISRGGEKAFVPQCGLAPGFISIVANELMHHFDTLETVKMRVGALPINPSNVLKYSLTWSTDGLINEYGNVCYGIENGLKTTLMPLEGYETIEVDGLLYEACNTSGGLGTLADTYSGKVQTMNYKTLRYPGHCEKIHFLMNDLKLNTQREILKHLLENAIPKTFQDVVLIYVSVVGRKAGELMEENYVKKIYPETIAGRLWSAIQVTTAAALCSVVDSVFADPHRYQGFITQETFALPDILANRFGRYYA